MIKLKSFKNSVVGAGLFFVFCTSAAELTPVRIALDWYMNPNHAPLLLAVAEHRFEAQGLKVELITPTDTSLQLKLLAENQVEAAVSFEPQFQYAEKQGLDLAWLLTLVNQPLEAIAVSAKGPIHEIADLKGRRIGYSGGGSTKARLEQVLEHHHLALTDIQLINVKMNESLSLLSGQVDAIAGVMRNVEPVELKRQGFEVRLFHFEDYGVKPYAELIIVVQKKNQDTAWAKAFKQVVQQAILDLQRDPEGTWITVSQYFSKQLRPTQALGEVNHEIWQSTAPLFFSSKK